MNDLDVMRLHADVLFLYDERGRMVRTNEPDGQPPPDVCLGVTQDGFIARFGDRTPDDLVDEISILLKGTSPPDGACVDLVREALRARGAIAEEEGGPVYTFPLSIPTPEGVVQVTEDNVALTRDTYPWLVEELRQWWPCFAVVRDGAAVAVCFSSRIGEEACEAGVDTLAPFRRRGFAATVTAGWARSIRQSGRLPIYSTSRENIASQSVARRLELLDVGEDFTWRLVSPGDAEGQS